MLELKRLKVSLTKHGAHKIALLLSRYNSNEVLKHLRNSVRGINIDRVQARKNLSVDAGDNVPVVWDKVRALGQRGINALTLIAIIFSHHKLIRAMARGRTGPFRGTIRRGKGLNGKEFTNFAHTLEALGFSTAHTKNKVAYDLRKLFEIDGLNDLVAQLLSIKFKAAGWDGRRSLASEMIENGFHDVLAISSYKLRTWLVAGKLNQTRDILPDSQFFVKADDRSRPGSFVFQPGHTPRKIGSISISARREEVKAALRHNEMQTRLYEMLVSQYGSECVGTENDTGHGTTVDVVVKTKSFCCFYEIKTAFSARLCIRQAIPQLLEYAYWGTKKGLADKLVIVGEPRLTADARRYLSKLRTRFRLPLYYLQLRVRAPKQVRRRKVAKRRPAHPAYNRVPSPHARSACL
jgi:hypothetical protein